MAALCYATDEVVNDSKLLGNIVGESFINEMGFVADDVIIRGDGVAKPMGILNSPALVTVPKDAGQTAKTISATNVETMYSRWYGRKENGVWLINRDCLPTLWQMSHTISTAGGALVWMPAGGISGLPYDTLAGMPVLQIEQCSTVGTVGDIILADLSQYIMITKAGIEVAMSPHIAFTTDQLCYRFILRGIDGECVWKAPVTPASGSSNTFSPIVALQTRS